MDFKNLGFFGYVGLIVAYVLLVVFGGWVISILWGWFVVPFFGLPSLGIVEAIGLNLTVSLFKTQTVSEDDSGILVSLLSAFLYGGLTLVLGWVVQGFM